MANITIGTPFNIDLEFKTAGVNKRMAAWAVDIVIISLYYFLMLHFIYPMFGFEDVVSNVAELIVIVIPVLAYQLTFELFMNGQTLGKKVVGIKVIDMEGKEPTWGQYLIRWILCIGNLFNYIIPYVLMKMPIALVAFMILYLPDFLCVIISNKSQRIGDLAAGTLVIDKNYVSNINETIYLEIEHDQYEPVFPQVMKLTDRDLNGIRNLLANKRNNKETEAYTFQVVEKIKKVLDIESELTPVDFLEQLLSDYNYFTTH